MVRKLNSNTERMLNKAEVGPQFLMLDCGKLQACDLGSS